MRALLLIFPGAGSVGVPRHFVDTGRQRRLGAQLPRGVFVISVSACSLDAAMLIERGDMLGAGRYFGGSVGLSVAALFLGLYLVRALT